MRRAARLFAAACIVLAARAEPRPGCAPIAGAELLWTRPGLRFLLVGEIHGTNEIPAIFGDLVCSAGQTMRPVIVGVELRDQRALDRFLDSSNRAAAAADLLSTPEWRRPDGRTSVAMLRLLEKLRALRGEGSISGVLAFSRTRAGESAGRGEERMASVLLAAARRNPDALVIALTGNLHACKAMLPDVRYALMASSLPPAATVTLLASDRGGEAWNCGDGTCGPHRHGTGAGRQRGIAMGGVPLPGFDGVLSTGLPATASVPAAASPSPVGPVRPEAEPHGSQLKQQK